MPSEAAKLHLCALEVEGLYQPPAKIRKRAAAAASAAAANSSKPTGKGSTGSSVVAAHGPYLRFTLLEVGDGQPAFERIVQTTPSCEQGREWASVSLALQLPEGSVRPPLLRCQLWDSSITDGKCVLSTGPPSKKAQSAALQGGHGEQGGSGEHSGEQPSLPSVPSGKKSRGGTSGGSESNGAGKDGSNGGGGAGGVMLASTDLRLAEVDGPEELTLSYEQARRRLPILPSPPVNCHSPPCLRLDRCRPSPLAFVLHSACHH